MSTTLNRLKSVCEIRSPVISARVCFTPSSRPARSTYSTCHTCQTHTVRTPGHASTQRINHSARGPRGVSHFWVRVRQCSVYIFAKLSCGFDLFEPLLMHIKGIRHIRTYLIGQFFFPRIAILFVLLCRRQDLHGDGRSADSRLPLHCAQSHSQGAHPLIGVVVVVAAVRRHGATDGGDATDADAAAAAAATAAAVIFAANNDDDTAVGRDDRRGR